MKKIVFCLSVVGFIILGTTTISCKKKYCVTCTESINKDMGTQKLCGTKEEIERWKTYHLNTYDPMQRRVLSWDCTYPY